MERDKVNIKSKEKKIRKNSLFLKHLSNSVSSPGEFLRIVIAIRNMNYSSVAEKLNTTRAYVWMTCNNKAPISFKAAMNFCKILDIDPFILGHVIADYNITKLLEDSKGNLK